uniref:Uncharacterized protein n=1 Tax=Ananas comosus var. bracteatus TaxID=296719 RepID=A0A6V7PHU3_ANACO|nr:unnamed protein product [Ananas comosus var. bracteatus]
MHAGNKPHYNLRCTCHTANAKSKAAQGTITSSSTEKIVPLLSWYQSEFIAEKPCLRRKLPSVTLCLTTKRGKSKKPRTLARESASLEDRMSMLEDSAAKQRSTTPYYPNM